MKRRMMMVFLALCGSAMASNYRETVSRTGGDTPPAGQPVTVYYDVFQNPGCPSPAGAVQLYLGVNGSWSIHAMTGSISCAPFNSSGGARYQYTVPAQAAGSIVEYVVRVYPNPGNTNNNWRKAGSRLDFNEWNTGYTYYGSSNNFQYVVAQPVQLGWMGATWQFPASGITPTNQIWIHSETWEAGSAKAAKVIYSTNGASWQVQEMQHEGLSGNNDRWTSGLGPFPLGTVVRYALFALDVNTNLVWDNNGGADFFATVSDQSKVQSISTPRFSPASGQIEPGQMVNLEVDVRPAGAAVLTHANFQRGQDGWHTGNALKIVAVSNGVETWRGAIGPFCSGDTGQCAVITIGGDGSELWANNGGANYAFAVKNNGQHLQWLGNTWHYPANGQIRSTNDLWINVETYPKGAASQVFVGYNVGGVWCCSEELSANGTAGNNDAWHVNLGRFAPGTVKYFIYAIDDFGAMSYDNNGGADFTATVN